MTTSYIDRTFYIDWHPWLKLCLYIMQVSRLVGPSVASYHWFILQGAPLSTEPGISLIILTPMKDITTKFEQQYVIFFHISYTMR